MTIRSKFEVCAEGLKKQITNRSKLLMELVQNAWDENSSQVNITVSKAEGRSLYKIRVEDDNPEGFKNLAHAYTLFAESEKKRDPNKRGRFNLGEKLFIAASEAVTITTTSGQVIFDKKGRTHTRSKRAKGSVVEALMKLTLEEAAEVDASIASLIPPNHITTTYNGNALAAKTVFKSFETTLDTIIQDDGGFLKQSKRKTTVELYPVGPHETPFIYEMGIPVVAGECPWHINICQKIPLNKDRDNITESYKKKLYAEVVNAAHHVLTEADAGENFVKVAISNESIKPEALKSVLDKAFGEKRVSFSIKDLEANNRAMSEGYKVVHGASLPKEAWSIARSYGLIESSEKKYPTAKPYSNDPEAKPDTFLPRQDWSEGMVSIVSYAKMLARHLLGIEIQVRISTGVRGFAACYSTGELTFFLKGLGASWFEGGVNQKVDSLLLHEFAHQYATNHLDHEFHESLCDLGARLKQLALDEPELFRGK